MSKTMGTHPLWLLKRVGFENSPYLLRPGLNSVGRSLDEKHIVCNSVWVSRHHCDIDIKESYVFIKDLGSLNGTYIDNFRVDEHRFVELKNGDCISLGLPYTRGQVLEPDHYVFTLIACKLPQDHETQFPVKRRASSSICQPYKRLKGLSSPPSEVTSTTNSPQVPSNDAAVVDVVDLTDDEPIIKEEVVEERERESSIRSTDLEKQLPISPLDQNPKSRRKFRVSFSSDMEPLANSTLINGAHDKKSGEVVVCSTAKNSGKENIQENQNKIIKGQNLDFSNRMQEMEKQMECVDISEDSPVPEMNFILEKGALKRKTPSAVTLKDCELPSTSKHSLNNPFVENLPTCSDPMKSNNHNVLKIQESPTTINCGQTSNLHKNYESRTVLEPNAVEVQKCNNRNEESIKKTSREKDELKICSSSNSKTERSLLVSRKESNESSSNCEQSSELNIDLGSALTSPINSKKEINQSSSNSKQSSGLNIDLDSALPSPMASKKEINQSSRLNIDSGSVLSSPMALEKESNESSIKSNESSTNFKQYSGLNIDLDSSVSSSKPSNKEIDQSSSHSKQSSGLNIDLNSSVSSSKPSNKEIDQSSSHSKQPSGLNSDSSSTFPSPTDLKCQYNKLNDISAIETSTDKNITESAEKEAVGVKYSLKNLESSLATRNNQQLKVNQSAMFNAKSVIVYSEVRNLNDSSTKNEPEVTQQISENFCLNKEEKLKKLLPDSNNVLPQVKDHDPRIVLPMKENDSNGGTTDIEPLKPLEDKSSNIKILKNLVPLVKKLPYPQIDNSRNEGSLLIQSTPNVENQELQVTPEDDRNKEESAALTSPQSANNSAEPKRIIKTAKGVIIKGAKRRTDKSSIKTCKDPRKYETVSQKIASENAELSKSGEIRSPNSSNDGFPGFDNSFEEQNENMSKKLTNLCSNKLKTDAITDKPSCEKVESTSKQEKKGKKESEIQKVYSTSNKNKTVPVEACRRSRRNKSSYDAHDVKKLLQDLEKSTDDLDNAEKSGNATIPKKTQDCTDGQVKKSSTCSKTSKDNEIYKKIEKELSNVLGEPLGEDSSLQSESSLQNNPRIVVEKNAEVIEIIDLEDDDLNQSFSQSGMSTVIEIDENDEHYSQIFQNNDKERNEFDEVLDIKPFNICTRIIKEEVDELDEEEDEDDLGLFDNHFQQCSQDNYEETITEISGPASSKRKANDAGEPSVSEPEIVAPEPKKPCKTTPPLQKRSSSKETVTEKQTVNIPETEDLTGVKLIKSTLLSKPPEKGKTQGKKSKDKEEPSATKQAQIKRQKEKIKLERSERLKNLAIKKKTVDNVENKNNLKLTVHEENEKNSGKNQDSSENSVTTRKVAKITERNRSTILLEGFLGSNPEPKRRGRSRKNPVIQDSLEIIEKKEMKTKVEPAENKIKSCIKSPNSRSSTNKVKFNETPVIIDYQCEGTLLKKVRNYKDQVPVRSISLQNLEINNTEVLADILHWNVSWRKESQVVKGDPPVYREVFNTKDLFVSYTDYKRWLYPLLLYEVWGSMMKRMNEMESLTSTRTFNGIIQAKEFKHHTREKLLTLHCCTALVTRNDISTFIDPSDILVFCVNTTGKKGLMMYGIVGNHIKFCSARETTDPFTRTYLSKLNFKPEYCAYFEVYVYNSSTRNVESGNYIKIQPAYNISTELKQYEGLLKLQSSPLLETIVDPEKHCTVFLSKDMHQKIIPSYPLNEEQKAVILNTSQIVFSNKPSISLVVGPPGTGKTRVIVSIVEQVLFRFKAKNGKKQRILICAQTNAAVDEICQRLLEVRRNLPKERHFRLSRYGRPERVDSKLADILTTSIARTEVNKMNLDEAFSLELSLLRAQERMAANALECPKEPERSNYKRKYEHIQGSIRELERLVNKTATDEQRRRYIEKVIRDEELKVIYHSDVVATTLASCSSRRLIKAFNLNSSVCEEKGEVGLCIVDEASQATELSSLLPLLHDVKNFILVGDPQQLPPMVTSETCKKNGLSRSLFTRLHKIWTGVNLGSISPSEHLSIPVFPLKTQYRMHPEIAHFPSKAFYKDQLVTPHYLNVRRGFKPYAVFTHAHSSDPDNETNKKEAELVVNFIEQIQGQVVFKGLSVGLIVPYQKQRAIIADLLHDRKLMRLVTVNTIDSYQGQEKDLIILTCVRTNGTGFLSDSQRTNVAITRAKRGLYIVGNYTSLQADPVWKDLFTNAQTRGLYFDLKSSTKGAELINIIVDPKHRQYW